MNKYLIAVLAFFLFVFGTSAQTPTPTPQPSCNVPLDLCESAWSLALYGGYWNLQNATTNNGYTAGAGFNFSNHFGAEARFYQTSSPSANLVLPGANARMSLAHIFPTPAGASFSTEDLEVFAHANAGLGWSGGTNAAGDAVSAVKKFAFSVGGGVDFAPASAPNVQWRILDVSYVNCGLFPNHGTFLGNHVAFASELKLVFGGGNSAASLRRFALLHVKNLSLKGEACCQVH